MSENEPAGDPELTTGSAAGTGRGKKEDAGAVRALLRRLRRLWAPETAPGGRATIAEAFAAYFASWSIELPHAALSEPGAGRLAEAGWLIRYLFGREGEREYLEFFAEHRLTNARHVRIWEDGRTEDLDSPMEGFVYDDAIPGDRERARAEYVEHNRRVYEELEKKGLIP